MIKFENTVTPSPEQWRAIIMGTRNPMNSWDKSDSYEGYSCFECNVLNENGICTKEDKGSHCEKLKKFQLGENDLDLMKRLRKAGTDHRKFMRMITVYVDITAPLYWWKEFDTYKVGTVANSCSTMHKIQAKEFTLDDFSHEHLMADGLHCFPLGGSWRGLSPLEMLNSTIELLNNARKYYLYMKEQKTPASNEKAKEVWWQMIQLLPSSYNQKRTVMLNYEVLANMYHARKNHKLDCWIEFCKWIETLPYAKELIIGE